MALPLNGSEPIGLLQAKEANYLMSMAKKLYKYGAIQLRETPEGVRIYTILAVVPEDRLEEVDRAIEDSNKPE